jgi:hypothetical protein
MINKRDYERIHGANQDSSEIERRWFLFEQEQAALTQQMSLSGAGGASPLPEPEPAPSGLLITSADFVSGSVFDSGTTTELGTNGVDGFEITSAGSNQMDEGYIAYDLTTDLIDRITAAYIEAGLDPTSSEGYVWNATWGAGSTITTGLIKFGFQDSTPASLYIQTIDPADTSWENSGYDGTPLVGTFLFPLTITIYTPLTDKNNWC